MQASDLHANRLANRVKLKDAHIITKMTDIAAGLPDVIKLGRGDPDLDTPPHIVKAGQEALGRGETHYGHPLGLPALEALSFADTQWTWTSLRMSGRHSNVWRTRRFTRFWARSAPGSAEPAPGGRERRRHEERPGLLQRRRDPVVEGVQVELGLGDHERRRERDRVR